MPVFANEVIDIKMKDAKKPGAPPWMELKLRDPNSGRESKKFVFDTNVQEMFKRGCGLYDLEMQKNEKGFWNVINANLVQARLSSSNNRPESSPEPEKATNGIENVSKPYKPFTRELDPNVVLQNRSICAQVAVKSAVELIVGLCENGKLAEGFSATEMIKLTLTEILFIMDGFISPKPDNGENPEEKIYISQNVS